MFLEEEVRLVGAVAGAGVPREAAAGDPAHAARHRHVGDHAPEPRREAAREELLEREAVLVGEDAGQRLLVRHVVGHGHGGAVRRAHPPRLEDVADEERLPPVEAVDVLARVGVPEVETLRHLLVRVVRVGVQLHAVGERVAEVPEELDVVLDGRIAPDLGRIVDVGVSGRDEGGRVVALHAAVGRVGVAVLQAEVGEPGRAERQADVAGEDRRVAVARPVGAGVDLDAAPRPVVLEQEVHHAGDGVRAVLRRCAVAQHLHLAQGDGRDGRDVGPLRAVGHPREPGDDRRAVPALAVHQRQRVVVGEVAQAGRTDERGRVADRVGGHVERRDQGPELVVEGSCALTDHVLERDGIDRDRRLGDRPWLRAAPDHHHPLLERQRQLDVERDRGPGPHRDTVADGRPEAREREGQVVGPGRQIRERERAAAVGCRAVDVVAVGAPCIHGHAGQHEARGVGDGAADGARLLSGRRQRHEEDCESGRRSHPKPASGFPAHWRRASRLRAHRGGPIRLRRPPVPLQVLRRTSCRRRRASGRSPAPPVTEPTDSRCPSRS